MGLLCMRNSCHTALYAFTYLSQQQTFSCVAATQPTGGAHALTAATRRAPVNIGFCAFYVCGGSE